MARSTYDPVESYTGANNLAEYTFAFKIESLSQLLVVEYNTEGVETQRVRGTDATYLDSVDYDSDAGGGTVYLAANLATGYTLLLLLANDSPTQPNEFKNKGDFTLHNLETSLDWVLGPVQRLTYLMARALKIDDYLDITTFDPTYPSTLPDNPDKVVKINSDGTGFAIGPSVADIEDAESYAAEAAAAAEAAETSAEDAEAAAAAAESFAEIWNSYDITDGQSATDVLGQTVDGDVYSSAMYNYEIKRGTTVLTNGWFALQYLNSTWVLSNGPDMGSFSGVTLSVSQAGAVGQLRAALDAGAGNGTLKVSRRLVEATI
jgi:hypothetical protein